jgi:hypothetical protein
MNSYYLPYTSYHLFISFICSQIVGEQNAKIIIGKGISPELKERAKNYSLNFKHKIEYVDNYSLKISKEDYSLVIFTPFDILTRKIINEFHGFVSLAEDGSFPYYRDFRSYDDSILNYIKKLIINPFNLNQKINLEKKVSSLYLTCPTILDNKFKSTEIRHINATSLDIEFWENIYKIFKVNVYPKYYKPNIVIFDSPIDGDDNLSQYDIAKIYQDILYQLSDYSILFRFSPRINIEREVEIKKILNGMKNIQIDTWNPMIPWEVSYKKNYLNFENSIFISQRCTVLHSITGLYNKATRSILLNKIFFKKLNYNKSVINDNNIFNSFITSKIVMDSGINAIILQDVLNLNDEVKSYLYKHQPEVQNL